jgi:thiol-disulfide isomerase/thioredoxin
MSPPDRTLAGLPAVPAPTRREVGAWLACALAGASQGAAADPIRQPRTWPKGHPTPPLALPELDAPPWTLAGARGRVVVLNFWATWCEPCLAEMPSLQRLAQRHAGAGLVVRAVNYRESEATIRSFLQRSPEAPPVLRDADGEAARAWQVRVFPTTFAVARNGQVAFSVVGELDWAGEQAQQWLRPLLAARDPTGPG